MEPAGIYTDQSVQPITDIVTDTNKQLVERPRHREAHNRESPLVFPHEILPYHVYVGWSGNAITGFLGFEAPRWFSVQTDQLHFFVKELGEMGAQ